MDLRQKKDYIGDKIKKNKDFKKRRDMAFKATMGQMEQKAIGTSLVPGMTKAQKFKNRYGK
jgi:hypothetical protein